MITLPKVVVAILTILAFPVGSSAETYYLDSGAGSDSNSGTSPDQAWASLERANQQSYAAGDEIRLQAGGRFAGKLFLSGARGTKSQPIQIGSYGDGELPVIDSKGYLAGIHLRNVSHVEVSDVEITADGGETLDGESRNNRYGVLVDVANGARSEFVTLRNLFIHHIFPEEAREHEGKNETTYVGTGIRASGGNGQSSSNIVIQDNRIETVGFKAIEMSQLNFVEVLDNRMKDIGGPAIQPGRTNDLLVRGNVVDGSGSFSDPRMHGRGSGIWPWTCDRVVIEKNAFMHARGKGDSCGIHIDFNCRDVIVQHNLSIDNEGGFIEILGNDHNSAYRYNISINDGARVKGENDAFQEGHVIWLSGFVGSNTPRSGPFNSYIYNNTIYVKSEIRSTFDIQESAIGFLVANNIFYIEGESVNSTGPSYREYEEGFADKVVWKNNLYQRAGILPDDFPFTETDARIGDPQFANAGGLAPEDYIPASRTLIEDQGIEIPKIPGDEIGVRGGLYVAEDFFGNPILGLPDMGAVEIGGDAYAIPESSFQLEPTAVDARTITMSAGDAPSGTWYRFVETSGNLGGSDSQWQLSPHFEDEGLLPNTNYSYTVQLRSQAGEVNAASSAFASKTVKNERPVGEVILDEDFSEVVEVGVPAGSFPVEAWFTGGSESWQTEADEGSVQILEGGSLRPGWGYDETVVSWISSKLWNASLSYRVVGNWRIDNVLDVAEGVIVGFAEFDGQSGALVRRIKEQTVGLTGERQIGDSGDFQLELNADELAAAAVDGENRVGIFIHHDDDGTLYSDGPSLRNDVYLIDDVELSIQGESTDSDADGISDELEMQLGLNMQDASDGALDLDGDGVGNASEALVGSLLDDASDFFGVNLDSEEGELTIRIASPFVHPGRLYILERATNAWDWTSVESLAGSIALAEKGAVFNKRVQKHNELFRVRVEWN
ncbi:right-handed parallel beta-helix repeat-containing protein [Pelagicoccus mobilis]|uniref:Right-handed parallel beta-helix repeat-containing protein n=1 Tax=Pelagicoccus mobilis TaxID=415221 RepID=A0A934RWX3_9BACT|nr:right-handed parallel beta-helix repeat-containing protein [Pelagicoccus mobilis]MBK1875892.1 right-handed parallel beta-helix repeat-containing protein [Pelagicoccus mobilis]